MKAIESKRVALDRKIVLRFPDFDGFVTEFATNVSMTGMFIRTREPQVPGTPLSFELRLEDGAPLVRGQGWVVWAREQRESADRPVGMGIEFTQLDPKSRRLVRWLILRQLPEGRPEFDVHSGNASAPITGGAPSQAAIRRRRRAGILAAAVLFVVLAGVVVWRELSETAATDVAPVPESEPQTTAPSVQIVGELAPVSVDAQLATDEARALVRDWARAWSDQDVEAYLAHYVSDFIPDDGGLSTVEWRAQRRERLMTPSSIRVAVTRVEVRVLSDAKASVTFLQTYRADGYADTVDKVLELARDDGTWKIQREIAD